MRISVPLFFRLLGLFVAYLATARFGLSLSPAGGGFASLIWPPTGIALAALTLFGYRLWPAVFLAAFAANYLNGAGILSAVGIGVGNTLEAVVGALLLIHVNEFNPNLGRVRDVAGLAFFGAGVSTVISSTVGVSTLLISGIIPLSDAPSAWVAWWTGDALANLVVAPLLFSWIARDVGCPTVKRPGEKAVLVGLVILISSLVFLDFTKLQTLGGMHPLPFALFPLIIWAALRFTMHEVVHLVLVLSIIAVWGTLHQMGVFVGEALPSTLLILDIYVATIAMTGMFLAAAIQERRNSKRKVLLLLREQIAARQSIESLVKRLEAALQSRDEFLSIASHELRTPITSLKLQLQIAHRNPDEGATADSEDLLTALDRQVNRLNSLIDTLLDVSQIREGKMSFLPEQSNLAEVVRQSALQLKDQLSEAGCEIFLDVPEEMIGHWDPARIEQVVTNLLSNSIKYAPGKPIHIRLSLQGENAFLTVEDRGPGIPPENQEKIFERFERSATANSVPGLGLGLFIVKEIVKVHRGTVQVENVPEKGARFTVQLPLSYK